MSLAAKIDIRTRFTIIIATTSVVFLVIFSAIVYSQAKKKLHSFAESSLAALLEHEWEHLDLPEHQAQKKATPHFKDVYLRIKKSGILLYDSFPKGFSDEFPPSGDLAKNKLFRQLRKSHNGHEYELEGFYDLTSAIAYLSSLRNILFVSCLLAAGILVPFSLVCTRVLLKPFRELANSTSEVSADKLTFRFEETKNHDEYGALIHNFNALLDRLEKAFLQTKRFALNASHELRTPLAVIISQGEMALRKERTIEEYRSALHKILTPAKRLREIINRLLFLAELERLEHEKKVTTIDVGNAIDELVLTIREAYGTTAKNVRVQHTNRSAMFSGNREMFDIVVSNLVENSYKYSKNAVQISYRKSSDGLLLSIEDDGPGIPAEHLGTVLEPLSSAQITPEKRGTGLGLSIVKACLDSIHGTIKLSQASLGGLSVTVTFPAGV